MILKVDATKKSFLHRFVYQNLSLFIIGRQAGAIFLGFSSKISRKQRKSYSFRWTMAYIILLIVL